MSVSHNATIVLAVLVSFVDAGVTAVSTMANHVFPPAIEGSGAYDAPVTAGDTVLVQWTVTKRTACPGENHRVWFGENGFTMTEPVGPTTLPMTRDPTTYNIPTLIPEQAPQGDLELTIEGYFQCVGSPRVNWELGPVVFTVEND